MEIGAEEKRERAEKRAFTRRAAVMGLGQLLALGGLASRLYELQVLEARRYRLLADDNRFNTIPLAPVRGRILDRFGVALATNEESFRIDVVPSLTRDLARTLDALAGLVELSPEERARVLARARRQPPHLPIVIAGDVSWDAIAAINLNAPELPGVETEQVSHRRYHHVGRVGHIVGHVGAVERLGLGDDPVLRVPGMRVGRAGVERGMDVKLRGAAGAVRREVDARGRIVREVMRREPQPGSDIALTIDLDLQDAVVARLAREAAAAVVVLDVLGGEVVAMASAPAYDAALNLPTAATQPQRPVRRRSLRDGLSVLRPRPRGDALVNRAVAGTYPPGSTFKIVTALAALEAGVVDLREGIHCSGGYSLGTHMFRCWNRGGHGRCDLHRAIRESCDVYFYEVARRMGPETLAAMAVKLGLGQTFDAGIAPQAAGIVPTPAWKRGRTGRGWLPGESLLAGIGQGYVAASPLQLAVMTARAATGLAVAPTLIRPEAGNERPPFPPLGISDRHLIAVQRALRAVVNEPGGTGARASLGDAGPEVAGKTGTSQVTRRSRGRASASLRREDRDHALFVGYVPAQAPRYAVAAVIEHGGGGGAVAAPLARDVIAEVVARDPMRKPAFSVSPGAAVVTPAGGRGAG